MVRSAHHATIADVRTRVLLDAAAMRSQPTCISMVAVGTRLSTIRPRRGIIVCSDSLFEFLPQAAEMGVSGMVSNLLRTV
jgi:hypothetical protein